MIPSTSRKSKPKPATTQDLRTRALQLPLAEEGVACAGTSLEKRTIKAGGKAFLFLGASDAMLKLSGALAEAAEFAAQSPEACKVGAHGWVTVKLGGEPAVPLEVLQRWIEESYGLLAPQKRTSAKNAARKPAGKSR